MSLIENFRQTQPARQAVIAAIIMIPIAALLLAVYFFVLRKPYEPLFTNLRPTDAATIVADLDKRKVAYRLADGGATILVPKDKADATRLSVANEDLPLKGVVGFELFNKSDMGLTEFAQRINYQRALQGELARTIMSMQEIDTARVHLAIAEPTIFRDDRRPSKASVSVTLRPGKTLSAESVLGIQRLVAAAVPELETGSVVVLDGEGRVVSGEQVQSTSVAPEMEAAEQEYADRISRALEKIYPEGVVHVVVHAGQPAASNDASGTTNANRVSGRAYPLKIAISIPGAVAPQREADVRAVIKQTLGGELTSGDEIVVSSAQPQGSAGQFIAPQAPQLDPEPHLSSPKGLWTMMLLPLSILLAGAAFLLHRRQAAAPRKLTDQERQAYVAKLRAALAMEA